MIVSNFSHTYLTCPSLCFYESGRTNQWDESISTFRYSQTFELFNNIFLWEGLVVLKRTVLLFLWHCLRLFLHRSSMLTGYPSALWLHAWHVWCTNWCLQTIRQGTPLLLLAMLLLLQAISLVHALNAIGPAPTP